MARLRQPVPTASTALTLKVEMPPGMTRERLTAQVAISAGWPSAAVIAQYSTPMIGETSITELVEVLKGNAHQINGGDLTQVEGTLSSQAAALNTMFAMLAGRAGANMGQHLETAEMYLKLALRAQSQCRATLETLATIKSPPVVIAKQANIAHGPQQVNNEFSHIAIARAKQIEKPQTELLEHEHGKQWLDTGTARATGASDQAMAAVEAVHRPPNRRRKSRSQP